MTLDDAKAIQYAGRAKVDEMLAATGASIQKIGQVGEGDIAIGRIGSAAPVKRGITVVVVPGAEATGLVGIGIGSGGREEDVLRIAVACRCGIPKVTGGSNGFRRKLVSCGRAWLRV